jgi:6-pyruvoyltetrahydropterin/6-carboxytetrahydropterin synthase
MATTCSGLLQPWCTNMKVAIAKPFSTKTYAHNIGLSCCFRQHRAISHCRFLHGYALQISLQFESDSLDKNNWVMDFGALKPVRKWLEENFDHKLLVAKDDPEIARLLNLSNYEVADVRVVEATGCEAFANEIGLWVGRWVGIETSSRVRLARVEVREHEGNSAGVFYDHS